jgi:phosphate starvation-inducible protein PhoH
MSTSFVRGITLNNAIVIIDEGQNLTSHEANSVITRLGKDTRVIVSGDIKQSDLGQGKSRERSGFSDLLKIFAEMDEFDIISFNKDDIVRSGLVKSYIITRDELEEDGIISPLY